MPFLNFGQTPMLMGNDGIGGVLSDPTNQALLALSAGLISGGGPSPVPRSFGQNVAQAGMGALNAFTGAQQANQQRAMQQAQLGMLQQNMRKAQFDADLTQQAMAGGMDASDPDQLEALGKRLAIGGHPGGATFIAQAEKIRAARQNQQAVIGMRSAPGVLGAGVTTTSPQGQALMGNLTGDQGFDAAILRAQNEALNSNTGLAPRPLQAPKMGLFDTLKSSPYVGQYAEQLQAQLDAPSATGLKAQDWLGQYDRLQQQHVTSTNQATARGEQADLRRDIADQASRDRRMLAGINAGRASERRADIEAQRSFQNENTLRDDFTRDTKEFRTVLPMFRSAAQYMASGQYNSSSDQALVYQFVKMNDPNDRVARGDLQDIGKLGGIPERFRQWVVAAAEGKELPERVRLEIFGEMRRKYENLEELQLQYEDEYEARAKRKMLKPENVVTRLARRKGSGGWSATEVKP